MCLAFSLINSFLIKCYLKEFLWYIKHCMDTNFLMLNFAEIHKACLHLFLVLSSRWSCGTRMRLSTFVYSCCNAVRPDVLNSRKLHVDTGWQEHQSSFVLVFLVALKHSMPCFVGIVASEVNLTFSLWRLLKGHLREVSCSFLWECFSYGECQRRCCQQRLPFHPTSWKAGAAVVVAAKTEKTLQASWASVTCAKETPLAKSEWKYYLISGIIELLHDIWDSVT